MEEIKRNGVAGGGIDFLYVDEAQDYLMLDAARASNKPVLVVGSRH